MYKSIKKGFTIVELVIVIAVIAVLAGVLIPSFSSIMKKANLSADKQAVREMNMALAADEAIHGRPANIETVMQVLANAGYNSDNWSCLTADYEVYWYERDNRLILYNAKTAQVEYPENYSVDLMVTAGNQLHIYNENHIKAVETNITLDSNSGDSGKTGKIDLISGSTTTETAALDSMKEALGTNAGSNGSLKSALGLSSDATAYVYGTRETSSRTSSSETAYATMQIMSVGATSEPTSENLKSNGNLKENVFYIAVNTAENPSDADIASAQKAAGDFVYTIFTQINTSQLDKDVCIVFPAGTTLDVGGKEWSAVKEFEGYFGTDDPSNPVVINGAKLSSATGYSQTVSFTGSKSKYFVTGFFGTVYGNTTIENVTFKNLQLTKPAMDFELATYLINGEPIKSRNSIGIIGGITDKAETKLANVVLRNIKVESSVDIDCGAGGAGLVGYIGSAEDSNEARYLKGTILIENCHVSATVHTAYDADAGNAYGPVGGLIGLMCRTNSALQLTIKDCIFDGSVEGYTMVGAAIGDLQDSGFCTITFEGTNDFSSATLTGLSKAGSHAKVGGVIGCVSSSAGNLTFSGNTVSRTRAVKSTITFGGTIQYNADYDAFSQSTWDVKYNISNGALVKK